MENEKIINRLKFILISNLKEYCYVNEIEDITDIKAYRNDIESRGKASIIREKLLLDLQIEYNEIDKEYAERSLDFLKNSTLDFKLNTANIYKSKVKEVERFIYSIEKEINQYRPFMIEDYLTNDEIKYVESGKPKYDNDLIDDKLTDLTGKILLVLMVLAVIITAAFYFNNLEDISFGNILKVGATFIIGLFFVSPMFFLIFIIT